MKTSAALFLTDVLPHKRSLYHKLVKNNIFGNHPTSYVFSSLKKSGVEGIELFLPSFVKLIYDDIYEVKNELAKHGMPVLSVHQSISLIRKISIAEITKLFHIADILKAKVIVVHMSSTGKQIFNKEFIMIIQSLQTKYNIKIGFENREKFIGSILYKHSWHEEVFPKLMNKIGLYMTLDTVHLAQAGGDIVKFVKNHKDRIVNIHLSDYKHHILNNSLRPLRFKHMPLGKGQLPIREFMQTLHEEKYKGLVTMEIHTDLDGMCQSAKIIKSYRYEKKKFSP